MVPGWVCASLTSVLSYPLDDQLSVFGRLGAGWRQQTQTYHQEAPNLNIADESVVNPNSREWIEDVEETHVDVIYGLGATYQLSESLAARLDATGVELENWRVFDGTLSVIYRL